MRSVTFLLILFVLECSCWNHFHARREWHNLGEPRIRAYYPKGIRVVVDSFTGPSSVKFVGTIYRDSKNVPIEGSFAIDTARQRGRRKWVYEDTEIALKVGDILNYEIFMEGRSGGRYKTYDGNAEIYELLDFEKCQKHHCRPSNIPPPVTDRSPPASEKPSVAAVDISLLEFKLRNCQQSVINTTNVLLELQSQILRLETKNELLANILSKFPEGKKLTMTGVIPHEGSPADVVNFIVWEKLDIKPHIVSAQRVNSTTIIFEVETIDEKLEILEEAEDRLSSGRITVY